MDIYDILARLAETPDAVKVYRDLQTYYIEAGRKEDALALDYLIETKFGKKDDATDPPNASEGQSATNPDLSGIPERD